MNRAFLMAAGLPLLVSMAPAHPVPKSTTTEPLRQALVEMRSIDGLAVSPDGTEVAFRVITPSLLKDRVAVRWFWTNVGGAVHPAVPIGRTSEPIRQPLFDALVDGSATWSPDRQSIYVVALSGGRVAVHHIWPGGDRVVAGANADVISATSVDGGRALAVETRNARRVIDASQRREERVGIHFDRSVSAEGLRLTHNFRIGNRWSTIRYTALGTAGEAFAGPSHMEILPLVAGSHTSGGRSQVAAASATISGIDLARPDSSLAASGRTILLRQIQASPSLVGEARYQVVVRDSRGDPIACPAAFCRGAANTFRTIGYDPAQDEVLIGYEPDDSNRTDLYGWKPGSGITRLLRPADGSLDGGPIYGTTPCRAAPGFLICVAAGPASPPRLVRIALADGRTETLFDPNGALRRRRLPPARPMSWSDSADNRITGVLVLPKNGPAPYPLVITGYRCRGFLTGGFTSLAPEYLLAERGIAALCVNISDQAGTAPGPDGKPVTLGPHLAAIDAYRSAIGRLAAEGLVDPGRVGLAGHSFSSMVTAYAISHTKLFKAAVIGTGITIDPATLMFLEPERDSWRKGLLDVLNLPHPLDDDGRRWSSISPALNAASIETPLLIQPPESEYLLALQLFAAMSHARDPVDMYVYPGEGHLVTRSPMHQLMRQQRSVDWFAFWLTGQEDRMTAKDGQYALWERLREERSLELQRSSHPAAP